MSAAISLLLPTRGRPDQARQMLQTVCATAADPAQIEVVLYLDRDDVPSHGLDHPGLRVTRLIEPRATMGAMTAACHAAATGRYLMLANDDLVFHTPGWDRHVLAAFARVPDDIALVWGNDLMHGADFATHPIVSQLSCNLMGGICPPGYYHEYIDLHLFDVFQRLRRARYDRMMHLPDVIFEHRHAGAAAAKPRGVLDEQTYIAWTEERRRIARRLARHIAAATAYPPAVDVPA